MPKMNDNIVYLLYSRHVVLYRNHCNMIMLLYYLCLQLQHQLMFYCIFHCMSVCVYVYFYNNKFNICYYWLHILIHLLNIANEFCTIVLVRIWTVYWFDYVLEQLYKSLTKLLLYREQPSMHIWNIPVLFPNLKDNMPTILAILHTRFPRLHNWHDVCFRRLKCLCVTVILNIICPNRKTIKTENVHE